MSNLKGRSGNAEPKCLCILRSCLAGGRDILVYVIKMKDKIYVDASQLAILRDLGGTFACATLREAMIAWDQLPDKGDATIHIGSRTYTENDIARFNYRPKPRN